METRVWGTNGVQDGDWSGQGNGYFPTVTLVLIGGRKDLSRISEGLCDSSSVDLRDMYCDGEVEDRALLVRTRRDLG